MLEKMMHAIIGELMATIYEDGPINQATRIAIVMFEGLRSFKNLTLDEKVKQIVDCLTEMRNTEERKNKALVLDKIKHIINN